MRDYMTELREKLQKTRSNFESTREETNNLKDRMLEVSMGGLCSWPVTPSLCGSH